MTMHQLFLVTRFVPSLQVEGMDVIVGREITYCWVDPFDLKTSEVGADRLLEGLWPAPLL